MDASRGRVAPRKEKNKDLADYVCTVCGATTAKLKYCVSCKTTRYCSKECQVVDWRDRGHKAICEKIRADREAETKRSEAPTPPSSPKPERPVFYGPAERTHADEVRARIKADHETARVKREANPEPEPIVTSERYGTACPICLEEWDVNKWSQSGRMLQSCCAKTVCDSCGAREEIRSGPCPLCRAPQPKTAEEFLANLGRHADNDVPEAIRALGTTYLSGRLGVGISKKKAARLLERASDLGDVEAMVRLSYMYHEGEGVKVDKMKAIRLCRTAAERGYAFGQFALSGFLCEGGMAEEAFAFAKQAADRGLPDAQGQVGLYFELGFGVSEDADEARRWYEIAAANGSEEAKDHLAKLPAPGKKAPRRRGRKR